MSEVHCQDVRDRCGLFSTIIPLFLTPLKCEDKAHPVITSSKIKTIVQFHSLAPLPGWMEVIFYTWWKCCC